MRTTSLLKQTFFCLLLMLCNYSIDAKELLIKGVIKDAAQLTPLSYVNIGIVNTATGTITAPNGTFELHIKDEVDLQSQIMISHLGYEDKILTLQSAIEQTELEILLKPMATTLDLVQVNATKLFAKTMGCQKTETKRNVSFSISKKPNQNLGAAIAKKFKAKNKWIHLDSLHFFIKHNNFDTTRFRINIHKIADKIPGELLNQEEIIIELTNKKQGWIIADLSPYNIKYNKDIIVSIEWIYHSQKGNLLRMPIAMPKLGSTHYYRYGSQNQWKKFDTMSSAMYLSMKTE